MTSKARQIADYVIGLFTDRATGNVGIGTSSPTNVKLQINGPTTDTVGTGSIGIAGGSNPLWAWRLGAANADLNLDRFFGSWSTTPALTILRSSGELQITGNFKIGSSVLATPTGSAPSYLCRAWVNFNGVSGASIRASGNVSSVTRNGTGDYTMSFTTAMPDADYAFAFGGGRTPVLGEIYYSASNNAILTTSLRFLTSSNSTVTARDVSHMTVSIFR
jgi:hypothetical protein